MASKQLRVGLAGLGFMGVTHYQAYKKIPGVKVVAVADEDPARRAGDWTNVGGNFGPGGGKEDLSGVRAYETLEAMCADPEIDLIDACLPTPFHKEAAIKGLKAVKHVLTEKPIALHLKDADKMLRAAKKAKRHLFTGQVLRYFPEYRFLKAAYDDGRYGKLMAAHFRRIIAKPNWAPDSWYRDPKKTGGATLDLHIHDADFIIHLLGPPKAVVSTGVPAGKGAFDYLTNQYDYGKKGPTVTSEGGWIAMSALPFEQSFEAYFEKGTVSYNSSHGPLVVYQPDGKKVKPKLSKEDGFLAELKAVTAPLKKGETPTELLAQTARNSLALCMAEQESAKTGKRFKLR
jgi:predicted dehydrogenase